MSVVFVIIITMFCSCTKQGDNDLEVSKDTQKEISNIEKKYDINLIYGSDTIEGQIPFEYKLISNTEDLELALQDMGKIFSRFPDDWAMEIANAEMELDIIEKVENVSVVLCEDLADDKDTNGNEYERSSGFHIVNDTLYLFADVHNFEPRIALAEMIVTRIIEKAVVDNEVSELIQQKTRLNVCELFESNNPDGFDYLEGVSEIPEEYNKYLFQSGKDSAEVYFVREEAMYSSYLDCLYTISPLIYTDEDEELPAAYDCRRVSNKCTLFIMNSSYMFDGEFNYWTRWFK